MKTHQHPTHRVQILQAVKDYGGDVSNREIARRIDLSIGQVNKAVIDLVDKGFLLRTRKGNHRRLQLTQRARNKLRMAREFTGIRPRDGAGLNKKRKCLKCRVDFRPKDAGNFVCATCKATREWKEPWMGDYSVSESVL